MSSLDLIVDAAVPAVVWLLMFVVGLELTTADFARVLDYRSTVLLVTAAQLLLLPLLAAALIWVLRPAPAIVAGLILVAASPGGALSNVYAYLAGAHVALSVTLTAVSSVVAMVAMPVLCGAGFVLFLGPEHEIDTPLATMAGQLVVMLFLPVAAGMTLRRFRPGVVTAHRRALRWLSLLTLALLVALILADQRDLLLATSTQLTLAAVLYSAGAMAAGWGLGLVMGLSPDDRFTLLLELTARNLAITTMVGVMVLDRPDFVLFATLFLLTQLPLVALAIALRGRWRRARDRGRRGLGMTESPGARQP
jgi:BASS family bile acid:Na+ symporter